MAKACGASTVDLIANGKLKHALQWYQSPSESSTLGNPLHVAAAYNVRILRARPADIMSIEVLETKDL
ncbi:hypothetical protein VPNG_01010 [Cytospora leucostoma]|uniref:Uncharacterized protein n=1 Tax=Cytospora leucostoma TaxID=1230097 RepID=A0A423XKP5_9PEZI|nr:hypothetical protein VPNG_01010 [Cytospora leucostoma]